MRNNIHMNLFASFILRAVSILVKDALLTLTLDPRSSSDNRAQVWVNVPVRENTPHKPPLLRPSAMTALLPSNLTKCESAFKCLPTPVNCLVSGCDVVPWCHGDDAVQRNGQQLLAAG